MPDIQCAWQILLQCAGPRCHLRTIPPSQSETYADGHDGGMWRALEALMGRLPGDIQEREAARRVASLPMRLGGLGFRSARRTAPAAYWAIVGGLPLHALPQTPGRDRAHHGHVGRGRWRRRVFDGVVHREEEAGSKRAARPDVKDGLRPSSTCLCRVWRGGNMAGSITRRPPLNTISGRP